MSEYELVLTPRRREIATLMTEGRTVSDMAKMLTITTEAVAGDVEYILRPLDRASRAEVASWLVRPEPPAPPLGGHRRAYRLRPRPA